MSATTRSCSARSASICSRSCSAARPRCFRSTPATSSMSARKGSARSARRRRSAPRLTALLLARWPLKRHVGVKMFVCVGIFGVATMVFGESRWMWLSLAGPVRARRLGHGQRLCPLLADPAPHARRDARPGLRRLRPVHLRLERARRVPRRPCRRGLRAGRGGGRRRRARGGGDRLLRLGLPELRKADRFVAPDPDLLAEAGGKDMPDVEAPAMAAGLNRKAEEGA